MRRAAALVLAASAAAGVSCGGARGVPTLEVRRGPFSRTVTAEGNLEAAVATPVSAPMDAEGAMRIAWLVPDGSHVKKDETVVRFDPTDMEKRLVDGRADRDAAQSRMDGTRAQGDGALRNLDRDADMARQELDYAGRFQQKDTLIFSRSEIIESEIDRGLAQRKLDHATAVRDLKQRLGQVDLDLIGVDRKKADLKIHQAEKGLRALEIKAPHDGILVFKRDWRGNIARVGDTAWSGEPLAEIPRLDTMQAKVYVLEADAGGLATGLPAEVVVESRPEAVFKAKISKVDSLARRRVGWIPVQYFGVTLEIEKTDPDVMKPGARVQATLKLDERADALAVPRSAVFEQDGKKIVYRLKHGAFEPAEVVLGPVAVGRVVIERGIAEGDVVALRDPTKPAASERPGEGAPKGPAGPSAGGLG